MTAFVAHRRLYCHFRSPETLRRHRARQSQNSPAATSHTVSPACTAGLTQILSAGSPFDIFVYFNFGWDAFSIIIPPIVIDAQKSERQMPISYHLEADG